MLRPPFPFLMFRHGETDWNVEGRFQGQTDIPINFKGRQQAAFNGRKLKRLIEKPEDWAFIASPMGRTRQTMEIARLQMELDTKNYEIDPRLIEITFGDWEKLTLDDIAQKNPLDVQRRNINKWNFVPPKGESYAQAALRVEPFLMQLKKPSIIVTHGGIIRAVRHLIEGRDGNTAATDNIPQDRIYEFDGQHGRWLK